MDLPAHLINFEKRKRLTVRAASYGFSLLVTKKAHLSVPAPDVSSISCLDLVAGGSGIVQRTQGPCGIFARLCLRRILQNPNQRFNGRMSNVHEGCSYFFTQSHFLKGTLAVLLGVDFSSVAQIFQE